MKKLKYILLIIILLIIFIPALLYFGSLDWSRKHSKRIADLPLLATTANSGEYRLKANGYEFVVRVAGMQNKGANVMLLHGFPESSIMWEALMTRLAAEGYRVLAFDQRGYSPQARPQEVSEYHLLKLGSDVMAVANEVSFQQFHLVGHDWGAVVGWKTVMDFPERIVSWTGMAIPHTQVFMEGVLNDSLQKQRSGYFQFFQTAYLPEFMLTYNGQSNMRKLLASLPPKHQEEYFAILAEPNALTAELNWYRAMNVQELVNSKILDKVITRPTLFIWGTKDAVIAPTVIAKQKEYINAPFKELSLDAGHALVQEKENEVVSAILEHLKEK
jgi:pimeloyl-ACP methyl ester carboxylesterase